MRAEELDPNFAIIGPADAGGGGGAGASRLKARSGGVKCPDEVAPTTGS